MRNPARPTIPRAPASLSDESRKVWRDIVSEYQIEDAAGLLLLRTALEALDRMRQAQQQIAADGATVRDRFDQPKPHPLLTVERDSRAALINSLKAMNLDLEPLRDRVGRPPGV